MKIPALIAANILIVGAGIMTYDVMRSDAPTAATTADGEPVDVAALEDRLDELERRLDGLSTIQTDRKITSRLLKLEQQLAARETGATPMAAAGSAKVLPARLPASAAPPSEGGSELADADDERSVEIVKKAMERIEADRERERSARGVDRMVDRLGLQLTDDQRTRLGEEFSAFRNKVRDNFRNGRQEGRTREDMQAEMETLRSDFGTSLGQFLSQSDADAIVEEMGNGGGGRRGPGGLGGVRGGGGGGPIR